jgi:hypothetical protein
VALYHPLPSGNAKLDSINGILVVVGTLVFAAASAWWLSVLLHAVQACSASWIWPGSGVVGSL